MSDAAISYETDNINLATTLMYLGAHLEGVECEIVQKAVGRGKTRTECRFHLLWLDSRSHELREIRSQSDIDGARQFALQSRDLLFASGAIEHAGDAEALADALQPKDTLQHQLDNVIHLWRKRSVRVEPRTFDDCKRHLVDKMRKSREAALRTSGEYNDE